MNPQSRRQPALRLASVVKSGIVRFCQSSSLRGVGRLTKTDRPLLTGMWLVFVLTMLAFMVAAVASLVQRYLRYETTILSTIHTNSPTEFPSTTICLLHPFPDRVRKLWEGNMSDWSPREMNNRLRQQVDSLIQASELSKASVLSHYDKRSMYYQSLDPDVAIQFGYRMDEALTAIMTVQGNVACIGQYDCIFESGTRVTTSTWSHSDYFNCFTLNIQGESTGIDSLTVIINIGKKPQHTGPQVAFVQDVFEQAWGVLANVHEAGQYPSIQRHSVYLQNGKLNELKFEAVRHELTPTPARPCIEDAKDKRTTLGPLRDLDLVVDYSHEKCAESVAAKVIEQHCRCLPAWLMRRVRPGQVPYCGDFRQGVDSLFERLDCLGRIAPMLTKDAASATSRCPERCRRTDYRAAVSQTDWLVSRWQMLRMVQQHALWSRVSQRMEYNANTNDTNSNATMQRLKHYYTRNDIDNLTDVSADDDTLGRWADLAGKLQGHGGGTEEGIHDTGNNEFVFLRVRRATGDATETRRETLTLNFYSLVCQIGGVCSLTLGLSCAFVVELFEWLYMCIAGSAPAPLKTGENSVNAAATDMVAPENNEGTAV